MTYYEKWAAATAEVLLERGAFTRAEIDSALGTSGLDDATVRFKAGDIVTVKAETAPIRLRKPHLRVPGYIHGLAGTVERECVGLAKNPEHVAFREDPARVPLYRVRFAAADVWEGDASSEDTLDIEIYQQWLEPAEAAALERQRAGRQTLGSQQHTHAHGNGQPHDHDHEHEERKVVEQNAVDKEGDDSAQRAFPEAVVQLCLSKGLVKREPLREAIEKLEGKAALQLGAKLTVKAWTDPAFKAEYLEDAKGAVSSLGIQSSNYGSQQGKTKDGPQEIDGSVLVALESSAKVHNLVVCTLCSCYPTALLGPAPAFYKSRAYRARAVRHPRQLLEEFGTKLPPDTIIRVHDSTADCRYIVLPARPEGTESWSQAQLEAIVTRDCLIGVAVPKMSS